MHSHFLLAVYICMQPVWQVPLYPSVQKGNAIWEQRCCMGWYPQNSPLADVMVHKTLYSHYFSYFGTAMAPFWKPLYNESVEVLIQSADESYADSIKVSLDILYCHSDSKCYLLWLTLSREVSYALQVLNLAIQSSVTSWVAIAHNIQTSERQATLQ